MEQDEISLKELILKIKDWYRFLLTKWLIIVAAGIIGGAIGVGYAFTQKATYTASLSFALEDPSSNAQAIGVFSTFGIDLGNGSSNLFSGSNLEELMTSRYIIEKTLLNPFVGKNSNQTFAEYLTKLNGLDVAFGFNKKQKKSAFPVYSDRTKFTFKQDSILGILTDLSRGMIFVGNKEKKSSILCIEVKSTNELFSKGFAESLAQEISSYYVEIKSKKARQNMEILQRQTDSIRAVLNGSIVSVATAVDNTFGLNPAMQVQKATISKKQFDVQANTAILTQLITNLEMAKVSLRKETPLIQVIDRPILPLKKDKVGKLKSLILGSFLAGFLTVLVLVFKKLLASILAN